ncbi:MAG: WD40/YVTN/BNR-like repeat-containing protein, partial [Terracidiphilus sp.]
MNLLRVRFDFFFRYGVIARVSVVVMFWLAVPGLAAQALWNAIGPMGGDARAFAAVPGEPHHLYLGTTNSWLYESEDGGASWRRLSKLDASDDFVVDHIVVDAANPCTVFAAAWKLDQPGGGLWVSRDSGRSWSAVEELRGQSIRAFAQAPSEPKILIAGTLEGVFESRDAGASWRQISPPGSREIHEVESLAIDPTDPDVVYAGTWHLPWKTTDGGKNWHNIKKGVIDDSDVFSIIIDPAQPKIVFASACSGIYKSEDAAELFRKIEGIPSTARRTRVLKQDPANREVVYAGTTEGLYKTVDGGKHFQRMTGPEVIVNDVYVDPGDSNHVLVATDRGGVLLSRDAGTSFTAANEGFSGRKVEALLVENPPAVGPTAPAARIFAGVVNDKSYGGVFVSSDGGAHWEQISEGLEGRDVFALAESPERTIVAGTNHGIFALEEEKKTGDAPGFHWSSRSTIQNTLVKAATETHYGKRVNIEKQVKDTQREMEGSVRAIDLSGDAWLAASPGGVYTSKDQGMSWQGGPVMGTGDYLAVAAHGAQLTAARKDGVVLSTDGGESWRPMSIPAMLTRIHAIVFSADGTLWLGAREGVYFTHDLGKTWMWVHRFPLTDVDALFYDAHLNRILGSSRTSDQVYSIDPKSLKWKWAQTGYKIALMRANGERLLA